MLTTIDSAGRVVVPKAIREVLGLHGGREIEINLVDEKVEIEVPPTPMRLESADHGAVAVADRQMPALKAETVRATLDRVRQ